jgi:hypothetical protein
VYSKLDFLELTQLIARENLITIAKDVLEILDVFIRLIQRTVFNDAAELPVTFSWWVTSSVFHTWQHFSSVFQYIIMCVERKENKTGQFTNKRVQKPKYSERLTSLKSEDDVGFLTDFSCEDWF